MALAVERAAEHPLRVAPQGHLAAPLTVERAAEHPLHVTPLNNRSAPCFGGGKAGRIYFAQFHGAKVYSGKNQNLDSNQDFSRENGFSFGRGFRRDGLKPHR